MLCKQLSCKLSIQWSGVMVGCAALRNASAVVKVINNYNIDLVFLPLGESVKMQLITRLNVAIL